MIDRGIWAAFGAALVFIATIAACEPEPLTTYPNKPVSHDMGNTIVCVTWRDSLWCTKP